MSDFTKLTVDDITVYLTAGLDTVPSPLSIGKERQIQEGVEEANILIKFIISTYCSVTQTELINKLIEVRNKKRMERIAYFQKEKDPREVIKYSESNPYNKAVDARFSQYIEELRASLTISVKASSSFAPALFFSSMFEILANKTKYTSAFSLFFPSMLSSTSGASSAAVSSISNANLGAPRP
jgi:hypothetical protein